MKLTTSALCILAALLAVPLAVAADENPTTQPGVGILAKGADVEMKDIKSWKMQSIYQK